MFAAKIDLAQSQIQSLKAQIEALQQEVAQFRAFDEEVTSITEAMQRLYQIAEKEGVAAEFQQALAQSVGLPHWTGGDDETIAKLEATLEIQGMQLGEARRQLSDLKEENGRLRDALAVEEDEDEEKDWGEEDEEVTAFSDEEDDSNEEDSEGDWGEDEEEPAPLQLSLPTIKKDSLVETPDGRVGYVAYLDASRGVANVVLPNEAPNFTIANLKYLGERELPPVPAQLTHAQIQSMGEQVLKCRSWEDIRILLQPHAGTTKSQILKEASLAARTKTQKSFIENLPRLIGEYCVGTGDRTDLEWLPGVLVRGISELLQAA